MRCSSLALAGILLVLFLAAGCSQNEVPGKPGTSAPTGEITPVPTNDLPETTVPAATGINSSQGSPIPVSNALPRETLPVVRTPHPRPTDTPKPLVTPKVTYLEYWPESDTGLEKNATGMDGDEDDPLATIPKVGNCSMHRFFPEIDSIPNYGISEPQKNNLTAVTPGQLDTYSRLYDENQGYTDPCEYSQFDPAWTTVRVEGKFTAQNTRPTTFNVTLEMTTNLGSTLRILSTWETLQPDTRYNYTVYIPMRADQVVLINSMKLNFTRPG